MARRYAGLHTLLKNPTWLEFPCSDGDPSILPKNMKQVVDSEGQVNFMCPIPLDESLAIGWRVSVGAALAICMGLPEGPKYVLKSFPEGYQLYNHNKGPVKVPRHDPYLCGSVNVNRFPSTNEFIPHALWLMQDATMNHANCSCKYCTKQPQRMILDNLGLSGLASLPSMNGLSSASADQLESISTRLPQTSHFPQPVTQMRFQGLWWGTECIWADELLHLKIAHCQFTSKGTDIIYPPASPSASTLEHIKGIPEAAQADPQQLGSSKKGLFMRIEGLFLVDVPGPDGPIRECKASGMAYELVDDDWQEVVELNMGAGLNGSLKGNQKAVNVSSELPTQNGAAPQDASGALTFMTQPSPLKPASLPNPDPSVPVSETANTILSQISPAAAKANEQKARTFEEQLSHPVLSVPYPLLPATKGFRFHPILSPEHEAVVSLSLISGRYYPGLFHHPLVSPTIANALSQSTDNNGLSRHRHLWAMEGLLPGIHQSMEPRQWRKSRMVMLQEVDKEAWGRFRERWEETKMARLHPPHPEQEQEQEQMQGQESQWEQSNGHVPMEVDQTKTVVTSQQTLSLENKSRSGLGSGE
ncbi:hypothetical protein OH77DRAFT_1526002 [Trametes cingulata]|nr:hypothetical protein OH77DRAFT_1526002 [Trametes cingulata]